MSCIDAAIIKALVEHIGIDPEDVPVGSPHECVKYTAGNGIAISGDNVISATDSCKCVKYTAGNGIAISGDNVISATTNAVADEQLKNVSFGTSENNYIVIQSSADLTAIMTAGTMFITENTSSGKRKYYYCIYSNKAMNKIRCINNGAEQGFTFDSGTLTTNINYNSERPVGVYSINSLELTKAALYELIRWLAAKIQ